MNGLFLSDDAGRTWTESSLIADGGIRVDSIVRGADGRLWAAPLGGNVYVSADDGATWTATHTFPYTVLLAAVPGPPQGDGAIYAQQIAVPQTLEPMTLYRTYDGVTWSSVGTVPGPTTVRVVRDVEIGPDGRLYVSVTRPGGDEEWVYRTTEPVVVSNEPVGVPEVETGALRAWPNPSRGVLHLEAPPGSEVVVYDVLGRAVLRARLGAGVAEANVSGLAPGVYVVRVDSQSTVVTVRR